MTDAVAMDDSAVAGEWQEHGFVVLPGWIPADALAPVLNELETVFPSATGFHDGTDPRRERFLGDEFEGIDTFPFTSVELSLLAVGDHVVRLAELLLGEQDLRIYSAEAWAKYTGAADYDQALHRDYLNHTLVVPTDDPRFRQLEMFVYLVDVPDALGPPHMLSRTHTRDLPARPNWYPPAGGGTGFVASADSRALYDAEVSAAGPAGTVVAFQPSTFHRGTGLSAPGGARYSMHLSYRPASVHWAQRAPGPTAATPPPGTTSPSAPPRANSPSSASRHPAIRTGPRRPSPALHSATPTSTSPHGGQPPHLIPPKPDQLL